MKKTTVIILLFCSASFAAGSVFVRVYLPDGRELLPVDPNFPHVYQPIMVGTTLAIVVDSNTANYWSGSLAITDANMDYGVLACRDSNEASADCADSVLPAAGFAAVVFLWEEPDILRYHLSSGSRDREAGQWFVIDYNATAVGTCDVGFYDHSVSWTEPLYYLTLTHVRTRDFNRDKIVDFGDFAVLCSYWLEWSCTTPDSCEGTNLDDTGSVDFWDLKLFADYWLVLLAPGAVVPPL